MDFGGPAEEPLSSSKLRDDEVIGYDRASAARRQHARQLAHKTQLGGGPAVCQDSLRAQQKQSSARQDALIRARATLQRPLGAI